MVRIDTPTPSDDEFDLLYDVEAVSEISDVHEDKGQKGTGHSSNGAHKTGAQRLSGPHEVPMLPYSVGQDDVVAISEQPSGHPIGDGPSSSSTVQRRPESSKRGRDFMNEGLQYTKSVYSKLWNKDALIAVMGCVGP